MKPQQEVAEFQSHRVRRGDFKSGMKMSFASVRLRFQSHRVRRGDFKIGEIIAIAIGVLFQSHRVRRGDFKAILGRGLATSLY